MNTKKTVFLLGAGASANAMPLNNQLQDRIENLASNLQEKITNLIPEDDRNSEENRELLNLLIGDLRWLAKNSKVYNTVDEFAKYLHDQNLQDDLLQLKIALVVFFELEPMIRDQKVGSDNSDLDPRYLTFYENIGIDRIGSVSGNYRVLSWNYDTQLELGRLRNIHCRRGDSMIYCLKDSIYTLNVVFKHSTMVSGNCNLGDVPSQFSLYKLNGVACMREGNELYALQNEIGQALTKDHMTGILLGYKNAKWKKSVPTISYAWEEDTIKDNNVVQLAVEAVKDAHSLVVIGYTFPEDNRKTDKIIIDEMKNLEKVYIQDFNPQEIENAFQGIRNDVDVELMKLNTGNEPFYVPFPAEKDKSTSLPHHMHMSLGGTDITLIF